MKKTIRKNVFETNSSSMHSISISNDFEMDNSLEEKLDNNNNLIIEGNSFGWEVKKYNDAKSKLNYCIAYIQMGYNYDKVNMLLEVLEENIPYLNRVLIPLGVEVDIDHQSNDVAEEAFECKETLKNFIFNKNSYLETDNDNH